MSFTQSDLDRIVTDTLKRILILEKQSIILNSGTILEQKFDYQSEIEARLRFDIETERLTHVLKQQLIDTLHIFDGLSAD